MTVRPLCLLVFVAVAACASSRGPVLEDPVDLSSAAAVQATGLIGKHYHLVRDVWLYRTTEARDRLELYTADQGPEFASQLAGQLPAGTPVAVRGVVREEVALPSGMIQPIEFVILSAEGEDAQASGANRIYTTGFIVERVRGETVPIAADPRIFAPPAPQQAAQAADSADDEGPGLFETLESGDLEARLAAAEVLRRAQPIEDTAADRIRLLLDREEDIDVRLRLLHALYTNEEIYSDVGRMLAWLAVPPGLRAPAPLGWALRDAPRPVLPSVPRLRAQPVE